MRKRRKKYEKISESNLRYNDYRLKAGVRVSPALADAYLALFGNFVLLLDRHSLGDLCYGYSLSLAPR